jgi:hypothetical protein
VTVAVVVLALVIAGLAGGLVWSMKQALDLGAQLRALTQTDANKTVAAERSDFEATAAKQDLDAAQNTNANLQQELQTDVDANPSADLAPDDIAGRLLRAQHDAGDAGAGAGDSVPAVAGTSVLADGPKAAAAAARLPESK